MFDEDFVACMIGVDCVECSPTLYSGLYLQRVFAFFVILIYRGAFIPSVDSFD